MVHNSQILFQNFCVSQFFNKFCIRIFVRVVAIYAVNVCGFYEQVGIEFAGSKGGTGIGSKEWITGTACQDYNSAEAKVCRALRRINFSQIADTSIALQTRAGWSIFSRASCRAQALMIVASIPI